MGLFKRSKGDKPYTADFCKGQIWKMLPTDRSHVTKPYYVEILEVSDGRIVTNIPGEHSLEITKHGKNPNWDYHIKRMVFEGSREEYGKLIFNQQLT